MLKKILIPILGTVFLSGIVMAQSADVAEVKEITQKYDAGLGKQPSVPFFDLSRLHMNQSYSISFFSGGGYSGSQALYNNMITYQLARQLQLSLNLGILHDPSSLWGDKNLGQSAVFLPSGYLDWRPSNSFSLSVGFQTVPSGWYNSNFSQWGRYPYFYR